MKKTAKVIAFMTAAAMVLSTAACASGTGKPASQAADTTALETGTTTAEVASQKAEGGDAQAAAGGYTYKIGVLQLVQHTALDAANEGFIAALNDAGIKYEVDQQNASGDQSTCVTVASKFANDKKDLILAIATPAAQAVAGAVSDTPILVTAVTDPAESGLVDTNEKPGGNVTGTSDLTPVKEQIALLQKILPDAKNIGILYCSAESNSEIQASAAREAIEAAGMSSKDFTVSSSNEIQTVVQAMAGKVDAIYAPTDNTIAAGMSTVSMVANKNNLPVICGEAGMVENGGLATYGIDYYQLGYMTGQQAVKILTEGASPADMPIQYLPAEKCKLTVNDETAAALGIDVSGLK
ncbi:ABC transporter substrate-binding protein [Clostridium porci]|uniref:ABC transporter substrate-binding protein n=1 Tax=Clostridium porci TaxID=2605778 RepID=A0A7X2NML2_9CLOT|nr:ABC transporter substrate-binding protein [Clostridium porci]MSS37669.1 ABC transporter substrate-binding protein [Clostridium porci]